MKGRWNQSKILTIRDKYRKFKPPYKLESWKYYEIVDILRDLGVGREEAYAAAKWASNIRETPAMHEIDIGSTELVMTVKENQ